MCTFVCLPVTDTSELEDELPTAEVDADAARVLVLVLVDEGRVASEKP